MLRCKGRLRLYWDGVVGVISVGIHRLVVLIVLIVQGRADGTCEEMQEERILTNMCRLGRARRRSRRLGRRSPMLCSVPSVVAPNGGSQKCWLEKMTPPQFGIMRPELASGKKKPCASPRWCSMSKRMGKEMLDDGLQRRLSSSQCWGGGEAEVRSLLKS